MTESTISVVSTRICFIFYILRKNIVRPMTLTCFFQFGSLFQRSVLPFQLFSILSKESAVSHALRTLPLCTLFLTCPETCMNSCSHALYAFMSMCPFVYISLFFVCRSAFRALHVNACYICVNQKHF